MQLHTAFSSIADPRRAQGRRYDLGHLVLFTLLALLSGATSYRTIAHFLEVRREQLNTLCNLCWKRAPAYHSIRYALQRLDSAALAAATRAQITMLASPSPERVGIAAIGCILRQTLERFRDRKTAQVLRALIIEHPLVLVLGQVRVTQTDTMNGIAAAQAVIEDLGLSDKLFPLQV